MANRGIVITTALSLVVITIVFFGLWVGFIGNWAVKDPNSQEYDPVEQTDNEYVAAKNGAIELTEKELDAVSQN